MTILLALFFSTARSTPEGNTCLPTHCSAFIITNSNSSNNEGYFFFNNSITTSVAQMLAIMVTSQETGQHLFSSSTDLDTTPANLSFSSHEPSNCCRLTIKLGSGCLGEGGADEAAELDSNANTTQVIPYKYYLIYTIPWLVGIVTDLSK